MVCCREMTGRQQRGRFLDMGQPLRNWASCETACRWSAIMDAMIPPFPLVLIGPMLWARLAPDNTGLEMIPHTKGPSNGDVVIVTDEPVIKALVEGQVAPQTARELGLIRFYGAPEAVQRAASWLDRLTQPAIEDPVKSSG